MTLSKGEKESMTLVMGVSLLRSSISIVKSVRSIDETILFIDDLELTLN